ncbi:hypothetical protein T492DRAFT_381209 [Pavlovales sp. CCMP2436]|nr:hypothetical protein T492DRAFT_381209 [Pavlovales sp. CCMP2436]
MRITLRIALGIAITLRIALSSRAGRTCAHLAAQRARSALLFSARTPAAAPAPTAAPSVFVAEQLHACASAELLALLKENAVNAKYSSFWLRLRLILCFFQNNNNDNDNNNEL